MAGEGRRFKEAGFKLPKPLIGVDKKAMVVQACGCLPAASRWIFICRSEHCRDFGLDKILRENFKPCEVVIIDNPTQGAVCTCLCADSVIPDEEELLISACDNAMRWDRPGYERLLKDGSVAAVIWTFRNNATVKRNPRMYGWVAVDGSGLAKKVSCKVPISGNPVNDHAIVGTFYFRKGRYFKEAARALIRKDRRVNNEFYVDELMNELIEAGMKVAVFEIDKYVCWGTPDDLKAYEYWSKFFASLKG